MLTLLIWEEPSIAKEYADYISKTNLKTKLSIVKSKKEKILDTIKSIIPDIIITDINMILKDEYQIIQSIRLINPDMQLICIGARYKAADAWDLRCSCYIIKPFKMNELVECLDCIVTRYEQIKFWKENTKSFVFKIDSRLIRIPYSKVIYFEKVLKKVKLVTTSGEYLFYGSLKSISDSIESSCFFRCHQGYIVNLYKIKSFENNVIKMKGCDTPIPVSRRMKKELEIFLLVYNGVRS